MKKLNMFLIIIYSTIIFAQVNFEQDFNFEKIDNNDELTNLQLFDYNNDGEDELIVSYKDTSSMQTDGKCVIYNQTGDTLRVIPFISGNEKSFRYASVFKVNEIDYIASLYLFSENNIYEGQMYCLIEIHQLEDMSLVNSEMIYIGYSIFDMDYYDLSINFVELVELDTVPCIYTGIVVEFNEVGFDGYVNTKVTHLIRCSFSNNSLTFIDEFQLLGKEIKFNNEINKMFVLGDSLESNYEGFGYSWYRRYKISTFENEYNPTLQCLDYVSGSQVDYPGPPWTTTNNFILQSTILTNNDLDINNLGVIAYAKISDDDTGTTYEFKNFSPTFSDTLWIGDSTMIPGNDNIASSTCISVNNESHYIMYFRGNQLEVRDRINGNIVHYQNSTISPFKILRNSDGELLFFVEQGSETGYDVYVIEGEIQVSAEENQISNPSLNLQNYPNPFNPSTTIDFSIQNDSKVELSIYNVKGQRIKTLTYNECMKGSYSIIWNGVDESNKSVSSGVYYYQLSVNGKIKATRKCLLLK